MHLQAQPLIEKDALQRTFKKHKPEKAHLKELKAKNKALVEHAFGGQMNRQQLKKQLNPPNIQSYLTS